MSIDVERETETRLNLVKQRYGDRLGPRELEAVGRVVRAMVEAAAAMEAIPLPETNEPLTAFAPFRKDG